MNTLQLKYQPPCDFAHLLGFLAKRAIPGVERVDEQNYRRVFELDGQVGEFVVAHAARGHALDLRIDFPDAACHSEIAARVRSMFDLDADVAAINAHLGRRRHLKGFK